MGPSPAIEDYLKAVFHLHSEVGSKATTTAIAARLGVASPSVSAMLKRLEADGLVERGTEEGIRLTPAGERLAVRVVRKHRLLETFLHSSLGLPWHEVHEEAEILEHALSDRLEARIDMALGHPSHDPHGDPIPPADLATHVEDWPDPLAGAPDGCEFCVERVSDRNPEALEYLAGLGILPGRALRVVERAPFDGPMWVELDGRRHALGPALTAMVCGHVAAEGGG